MAATKQEIEKEISEYTALLDAPSAQPDEKTFAKAEIEKLQAELKAFEVKEEKVPEPKEEKKEEKKPEKKRERPSVSKGAKEALKEEKKKEKPSIEKQIKEYEDLIASPDAMQDEKDFAAEQIKILKGKAEEKEKPAHKPRGRKKGWKKQAVIKPEPIREAKKEVKPFKKRAKKKAWKKQAVIKPKPLPRKPAKEKKVHVPIHDAIFINKLLTRQIGRIFHDNGIRFAIAPSDSARHSLYVIPYHGQLSKAYKLYHELAEENDVKVSKEASVTKF